VTNLLKRRRKSKRLDKLVMKRRYFGNVFIFCYILIYDDR